MDTVTIPIPEGLTLKDLTATAVRWGQQPSRFGASIYALGLTRDALGSSSCTATKLRHLRWAQATCALANLTAEQYDAVAQVAARQAEAA